MEVTYNSSHNYLGYLTLSIDINIWDTVLKSALKVIEDYSGLFDYDDLIIDDDLFSLAISFLSPYYFSFGSNLMNLKAPIIIDAYVVDMNETHVEIEYFCFNQLRYEVSQYLN